MEQNTFTSPERKRNRRRRLKQAFNLFLVFVLLVNMLPTNAFAVWDGQGNSGNSNASDVNGGFNMPHANEEDILGYRFTVYGQDGKKLPDSYSVDIDRYDSVKSITYNTTDAKLYRSYGTNKKSHIDLYREYQANPSKVTTGVNNTVDNTYHYVDTSLPATPTEVEHWLTDEMASIIAGYAGASASSAFSVETCYIIVEPIIVAKLQGEYFACTMAEYACFQASSGGANYGWTGLGADTFYSGICISDRRTAHTALHGFSHGRTLRTEYAENGQARPTGHSSACSDGRAVRDPEVSKNVEKRAGKQLKSSRKFAIL